ncbi:uncharacterized protein LOC106158461 [Lingula anatina]|uniref:Uncharacterized protein LOC106158461 n=1 Tax=Lingula anatina TaxID=7574 RepID=A0A1S3HWI4_LINAN|nr:uncharacterized protein LOC106158461 [Lingula anatina]|eukprot:XP_013389911.1 uncharacterized protein LOC106158461 [Lingula anatina]
MTSSKSKKVWIQLRRFDLEDEEHSQKIDKLNSVYLADDMDSDFVKIVIREAFGLFDTGVVMKLRNHRGSLIPINSALQPNSKSVPYVLEIFRVYQNIKPLPRSIRMPGAHESVRKSLNSILQRIENVENATPELKQKRDAKLAAELEDLDRKLVFLNKRLDEASGVSWKGMFKKHPMW